jgi:hypothetical protein
MVQPKSEFGSAVKPLQDRTCCGASAATLIGNDKSASVYECARFIWPYNAQTVEMAVRQLKFAD